MKGCFPLWFLGFFWCEDVKIFHWGWFWLAFCLFPWHTVCTAVLRVSFLKPVNPFLIFIHRALLTDVVFMLFCCCTALHLSLSRLHEARYLINNIRRAQVERERKCSFWWGQAGNYIWCSSGSLALIHGSKSHKPIGERQVESCKGTYSWCSQK